jgi:hypothetical protein
MRTFKALAALALTSLTLIACGSSPEASPQQESTSQSEAAVSSGGIGATCGNDSNCNRGLVCEPICPVIPGRPHCMIFGGTCEPTCTRWSTSLAGSTFTSTDGAHSITFDSATHFTKTDGCPQTGIHCNSIQLTTGTYVSYGTSISLRGDLGQRDTMAVEAHCYQGLLDANTGAELYPAN